MSTTQSQLQHRTSHRETIFVREYLLDLNGTRAAIAAGYSSKTASVAASRMLKKVKVQALLKQMMEERRHRLDISAERVLRELARIAFFDPRKLFNHDGSLKNIAELDADTAAAIAGIEIVTGPEIRRRCTRR
jgi:phage terminase small subunit